MRVELPELAAVSSRFCRAVFSSRGLAARRVCRTLLPVLLEEDEDEGNGEGWGRSALLPDETVFGASKGEAYGESRRSNKYASIH